MVMGAMSIRTLSAALLLLGAAGASFAQTSTPLTLQDALNMARQRNGTIRAAQFDVKSARSQVVITRADYFPTITPSYVYNSERNQSAVGSTFVTERGSTQLAANWRLLDSGQRSLNVRSAVRNAQAAEFNSIQTLRGTLFTVHQQYYDALRAQELQKVAEAQVDRAKQILAQTEARIEAKDAARKDRLQAVADLANAEVEALTAKNQTATSGALLKASIGIDNNSPLPELEKISEMNPTPKTEDLSNLILEGLKNRADLLSRRRSIESQEFSRQRAERDAGITFSLDGSFNQEFTPDRLQNRGFVFTLSYPLFDGGRLREEARQVGFNIAANRADLVQAERAVRAEIESTYAEYVQNSDRLRAAKTAIDAARENYNAAEESQKLGAATLIDVLTAQVSLVTAESNYIEALYDYTTSEVKVRLVAGRPIPGEIQ